MNLHVKYCGPALDYSGYGEANRHDIAALTSAGVKVKVELTRHCLENSEFGWLGELVQDCVAQDLDYRVKILHTTPNIFGQFIEPAKYHIGRVFWETDKLPEDFARGAALCDEIWTGSKFNAQALWNAGVRKPIFIIPEAVDANPKNLESILPYPLPAPQEFYFYSIFEWTERKNPLALLEAYWREFEETEGVNLVIKTYLDNFTPNKMAEIDNQIKGLKKKLQLTRYAPVSLSRRLMDRRQVYRFHRTFHCFVSAHRGEGWGIPQMEAMLLSNPVISTNCGGIHEYLKDKEEALLIPCEMVQVANTRNQQWYCSDQNWGQVDIEGLRQAMRYIFDHNEAAGMIGEAGRQAIERQFALPVVGEKMRERLEALEKEIDAKAA